MLYSHGRDGIISVKSPPDCGRSNVYIYLSQCLYNHIHTHTIRTTPSNTSDVIGVCIYIKYTVHTSFFRLQYFLTVLLSMLATTWAGCILAAEIAYLSHIICNFATLFPKIGSNCITFIPTVCKVS